MENTSAPTKQQQYDAYVRRVALHDYARRNFLERANAYDERVHGAYRVYMEQCEEQYQSEINPSNSNGFARRR